MIGGISEAILLVALGLGYIVLYLAKREEKALQIAGYLIGTFIILLSGLLILNTLLLSARFCKQMSGIKGMKGMMPQHGMMKGQPAQVPAQK